MAYRSPDAKGQQNKGKYNARKLSELFVQVSVRSSSKPPSCGCRNANSKMELVQEKAALTAQTCLHCLCKHVETLHPSSLIELHGQEVPQRVNQKKTLM